ncbi:MAG: flagellar cap protein FliD [Gammaproteobacteria bacterium HGW-Gammaproteobacteria-6]|nr:MAG: flagellar cap protein FliD [Gammaproteobacteria bacterium HGW-Gammaproteobacteria-6]
MAVSTITGLGSGLDIDSLVTAIADAQKAPKQAQIDRLTTKNETTLSAVGTLKSALETFEASMAALSSTSTSFDAFSAKSSGESVASVTAESGAVAGTYSLEVNSLATGSKVATASLSGGSSTTFASGGDLTISIGDNASYNLSVSAGASLTEIRDSINSQLSSSAGISANIVTDSNGSRLVISSETTGEGTDLSVSGTGDLAALDINNTFDAEGNRVLTQQSGTSAGYITLGANSSYSLDGMELSSATNTITALSGLTINLTGKGSSTLTVGANTDGLKTSVETFVTAYNTLMTITNALTKVSPSEDGSSTDAGAMVGDSSIRSLTNSIRNALTEPSSSSGSLSILAQLGVTTNKDGTLGVDDAKLTSALESNYADMEEFFSGSNGLLSRLGNVTGTYTASGGLLDTRTETIETTLADLTTQQEALDRRIESVTAALYTKYNNMDSLVAQLTATSDSILATLNALNNNDD